jgi:hypothetical protein
MLGQRCRLVMQLMAAGLGNQDFRVPGDTGVAGESRPWHVCMLMWNCQVYGGQAVSAQLPSPAGHSTLYAHDGCHARQ